MVRLPRLASIVSVEKVLVAEQDHSTFTIAHPKSLALFASPLIADREKYERDHAQPHHAVKRQPLASVREEYSQERRNYSLPTSQQEVASSTFDPEEPVLHHAHESSTIQLFYDLFFVANLTTFTAKREINDIACKLISGPLMAA